MTTRVETMMRTLTNVKRIVAGTMMLMSVTVLAAPKAAHAQVGAIAPITYNYYDSDGPGQLLVQDLGYDAATAGRKIFVRLAQYGVITEGAGFQTPVGDGYLISFTVRDAYGYAYVFRGQIGGSMGDGVYARAGSSVDISGWHIERPLYR
jgi:hypothetical protein